MSAEFSNAQFLKFDKIASSASKMRGGVVVIGNFDGVHAGHRVVLEHARKKARSSQAVYALCFEPHPRTVFRPDHPVFRLSPAREKAKLFEASGIDGVINWEFTRSFASKTAAEFVDEVLIGSLAADRVVVGFDFHFGKDRQGSPDYLMAAGKTRGFDVTIVPEVRLDGDFAVSSSAVRKELENTHIEQANAMLGYRWFIMGKVIHGEKRGRELGFPTTNMHMHPGCRLAQGIYAVTIRRADGTLYRGVASYGRRPQFDNGNPLLETYIFDLDASLYDEELTITFHKYLRSEAKFDSLEALMKQMQRDCDDAAAQLNHIKPLSDFDKVLNF